MLREITFKNLKPLLPFSCVRNILDILAQCNRPNLTLICTSSLGFSCLYILMLGFIITNVIVLYSYIIKI